MENIQTINHGNGIVEVTHMNGRVNTTDDFLSLAYTVQAESIILAAEALHPEFFDLKNGIAGEILQKASTYRRRVGIKGDFSKVEKKSLRDFIRESNRGGQIIFKSTTEEIINSFR